MNIINVDFKSKQVVDDRVVLKYTCSICHQTQIFDSKYDKHKPLLIQYGRGYFCKPCIDFMHSQLEKAELEMNRFKN